MTQASTKRDLTPDQYKTQQESVKQDTQRALQEGVPDTTLQTDMQPRYPAWPTSMPGPMRTPPPPGTKPINAIRREQVAEVGYNQETGEPSTQVPERTLPQGPIRRKERL